MSDHWSENVNERDWHRLTAEHDQAPERDSSEWLDALASLDDPDEWEKALEADPLMMFQRLPEEETTPVDIEAMKTAVRSMRRTHELETRSETTTSREKTRLWALAALLAMTVSAATWTGSGMLESELSPAQPTVHSQIVQMSAPAIPDAVAQLPLLEDVDPDIGPFMQIEDDGLSLVVVMGAEMDLSDDDA